MQTVNSTDSICFFMNIQIKSLISFRITLMRELISRHVWVYLYYIRDHNLLWNWSKMLILLPCVDLIERILFQWDAVKLLSLLKIIENTPVWSLITDILKTKVWNFTNVSQTEEISWNLLVCISIITFHIITPWFVNFSQ